MQSGDGRKYEENLNGQSELVVTEHRTARQQSACQIAVYDLFTVWTARF